VPVLACPCVGYTLNLWAECHRRLTPKVSCGRDFNESKTGLPLVMAGLSSDLRSKHARAGSSRAGRAAPVSGDGGLYYAKSIAAHKTVPFSFQYSTTPTIITFTMFTDHPPMDPHALSMSQAVEQGPDKWRFRATVQPQGGEWTVHHKQSS